jgi:hypothetical protein
MEGGREGREKEGGEKERACRAVNWPVSTEDWKHMNMRHPTLRWQAKYTHVGENGQAHD